MYSEKTIPINQNSHVFSKWIDETPSDCTVIGTKGHKDCKLCGKHFDIDGKEISDITIPTDNNHDWGDWHGDGNGTHSRTCRRNPTHVDSGSCLGGNRLAHKRPFVKSAASHTETYSDMTGTKQYTVGRVRTCALRKEFVNGTKVTRKVKE